MVRTHLDLKIMEEQGATLPPALPSSYPSTCILFIGKASFRGHRGHPLVMASHILVPSMRILGLLSKPPQACSPLAILLYPLPQSKPLLDALMEDPPGTSQALWQPHQPDSPLISGSALLAPIL